MENRRWVKEVREKQSKKLRMHPRLFVVNHQPLAIFDPGSLRSVRADFTGISPRRHLASAGVG